jgi:imidazolonepropionase-like amidohydrolase
MDVIVAATRTNAEAFRKDRDLGTLEPGKKADLLIVGRDPLDDIAVLYDPDTIRLVMKDGRIEYVQPEYRDLYSLRDPEPSERRAVPEALH